MIQGTFKAANVLHHSVYSSGNIAWDWGSQGSEYAKYDLLDCNGVWPGDNQMFYMKMSSLSSGSKRKARMVQTEVGDKLRPQLVFLLQMYLSMCEFKSNICNL
jgi:hypothetical protein